MARSRTVKPKFRHQDNVSELVKAFVCQSTSAQGLPEKIADESALQRAAIFAGPRARVTPSR